MAFFVRRSIPVAVRVIERHPTSRIDNANDVHDCRPLSGSARMQLAPRPNDVGDLRQDDGMTATLCAFCEKHSHMTPRWVDVFHSSVRLDEHGYSVAFLQATATCDNCGHASLALADNYETTGEAYKGYFNNTPDENFEWFPRIGAAKPFLDVPEHIARAAKEAHASFSINAFMAAILMARTVVEATAKEKGVTTGNLLSKIDALASQAIIRDDTKDAAHEIRHLGNDMAHGDISDVPDAEDVEDVLALMDEVLNEVFQGPAKTARLRRRRASSV